MKYFFSLFLFFIVVGCASKETEYVITTEYQYVTYQLPVRFTSDCKVTKPMSITEYTELDLEERENYLANYVIRLLGDIKRCDSKLKGIMKYVDEVNKMAKGSPTPKNIAKDERIKKDKAEETEKK